MNIRNLKARLAARYPRETISEVLRGEPDQVSPELRNFKKWVYKQKLVLLLMEDGTLRLEDRKEVDRND